MRILTDNTCIRSTLSSENESLNYPASNLIHDFLRLRWQATGGTANKITVTFTGTESMNCIYIGYTNADSIDVELFDAGAVSLFSDSYTLNSAYTSDCFYFDSVITPTTYNGVKTAEITVNLASGTMYVGGLALGVYFEFPISPTSNTEKGWQDNSTSIESPFGQSLQNYVEPLDLSTYSFDGYSNTQVESVKSEFYPVGNGGKFWMDYNHLDHSFKHPNYVKLNSFSRPVFNSTNYDFTMEFQEAR